MVAGEVSEGNIGKEAGSGRGGVDREELGNGRGSEEGSIGEPCRERSTS